jgi:calpain-15
MNIERLVQLRNPWGKGEWKGDWSDQSPYWTPQMKKELYWESADDGVFYMNWNDFLKYYSDL